MLGSRFLGDPLAGGMPRWKYVSNRFLTAVENLAFGLHLSEYHTGFRAYSRSLLESIPYRLNSNDFVFDQELVAQAVACGHACRRDRRPDPVLRGGQLGQLPPQRRLRPVHAAGGGAVRAAPTATAPLGEAGKPKADDSVRSLTTGLARSGIGILISLVCLYLVLRGVDLGQTAGILGGARLPWLGLGGGGRDRRPGLPRASLAGA